MHVGHRQDMHTEQLGTTAEVQVTLCDLRDYEGLVKMWMSRATQLLQSMPAKAAPKSDAAETGAEGGAAMHEIADFQVQRNGAEELLQRMSQPPLSALDFANFEPVRAPLLPPDRWLSPPSS